MDKPSDQIFNRAQLQTAIKGLKGTDAVTDQTCSELCSAITRFCKICGLEPSQVYADPAAVRVLRSSASWQLAGITKQSWMNILSKVKRALGLCGITVDRRYGKSTLAPPWAQLVGQLNEEDQYQVQRLGVWCSTRGINPSEVKPETFSELLAFLEAHSTQRKPREQWHGMRRAWNRSVAIPGSGFPQIPNDNPPTWRSRKWEDFPDALQTEVAAWVKNLADGDDEEERDPLRPATIKNYKYAVRRFCSRLVDHGAPVETVASLPSLFALDRVKAGLKLIQGGRSKQDARADLHIVVQALLSVARFLEIQSGKVDAGGLAALIKAAGKLRDNSRGMVKKNRDRLAKLNDPKAARLFRNLHIAIAERYAGIKKPTVADAHEMQMAAVHAFLLALPLRISNVAALDFHKHVTRPAGGNSGPWRVSFQGHEMKNGDPYESNLDAEASAFLDDYVARFRPLLAKEPSSVVFVSRTGKAKAAKALSAQYSAFIQRKLGLRVHAHLTRHHAGLLWLNALPGEYRGLSKFLGHRSETTTVRSYTGAETKTHQDRYHLLLDNLRKADREQGAVRPDMLVRRRRAGARR